MKDKIIEILNEKDKPSLSSIEINDLLDLNRSDEYKELQDLLESMCKDGTLYYSEKKKKYVLMENSHLLKGKFIQNKNGYGFVVIGNGREDIYIGKNNLNNARHNDTVLIELIGDKTEGKVIKILTHDESLIVGEVYIKDNKYFVRPDRKGNIDINIPYDKIKGAVEGHKVVVKPLLNNEYVGEIIKIIGHKNDVGVDILSFVYDHGFKPEFPEEVILELDNIPSEINESDCENRLDLRDKVIFTIDGDDTKDIDDAISIEKFDDGTYELGVHIADVSHYVTKNSKIDDEAYERGTSVYLVDRVLPMLPHKLSNGICSLNPNVDRLTLSCIMKIDKKGNVTSYKICESVIRSRIQMTYNKVNDILENNIVHDDYKDYELKLRQMNELSKILRNKMVSRGYIEFESPEAKIIVDENCHPIDIKVREQRTGERLIENFMIAANETVASHLFYRKLPSIYRVHDKPDQQKLQSFLDYISVRGYVVKGKKNKITSSDLQYILSQLEDKPDVRVLNEMAIKSQSKAIYSDKNIGHFGLGSKCYAHFTSPIRRYPDLTLHRLVKDYEHNLTDEVLEYWASNLPTISLKTSLKEQDSVECERDVDKMKKAEYMEDHIGEVYKGVISGVQEFGIFVQLDNTVEGLIKKECLLGDNYVYNNTMQALVGRNNKNRYMFGDEVTVKVINASRETSMVDFEIIKELYKKDEKEEAKNKKKIKSR